MFFFLWPGKEHPNISAVNKGLQLAWPLFRCRSELSEKASARILHLHHKASAAPAEQKANSSHLLQKSDTVALKSVQEFSFFSQTRQQGAADAFRLNGASCYLWFFHRPEAFSDWLELCIQFKKKKGSQGGNNHPVCAVAMVPVVHMKRALVCIFVSIIIFVTHGNNGYVTL